ncbi:hypothetical protein CU098_007040, partial [Rhizopus stolonifer]
MATGEEILNQAEQTNSERQLLELQLEGQRYKRLRSITNKTEMQNQSSRVLEVAEEVELNNWKNKCISHLPHNRIVDFSNKIQLKLIEISLKQLKSRFELKTENVVRDLDSLNKLAKKAHNHTTLRKVLGDIEAFKYTSNSERRVKMIYVHILDQIHLKNNSEMSFLAKFWAPVIELFFDPNKYFVQWGDTTSPHLSLLNLHFNLDFRIIIKDINTEALDTLTGEFACESAIAPHKVYFDFLKSALTTKAHLNAALRRLPYIPPSAIKLFIFPFVQIMGLTCNVY